MAHYAKVLDNKVTQVITAEPEFFETFIDTSPGEWIQTSYNTRGGVHINNGTAVRGNFAGIGFTYDRINDVFYTPRPYASWTLNESTWLWDAPVAKPNDIKEYTWNESTTSWDLVPTVE